MKYLFVIFSLMLFSPLIAEQELVKLPHSSSFEQYWTLVEEHVQESESMQEWIPSAESEDNWTKSFGVQHYQLSENYDIHYFYQMFIETLTKDFQENKSPIQHEIISEDVNHILFSWWSDESELEIGREWVHILKDSNSQILFVRFATKKSEIDESDKQWVECLEQADFFTAPQNEV